jgi:hypothetical protein
MSSLLALWIGCGSAAAGDEAGLFWQQLLAVTVVPGGLLTDTGVEYRAPFLRFGDPVSNMTYVGAGGRVSVSPAHAEVAARLSMMPVDVLPIKIELVRTVYWKSYFGLIGMDNARNTSSSFRKPRYEADEGFAGTAWTLIINPGGQIKVGPIVGFTSPIWSFMRIDPAVDVPERWVYDPYRGLVVDFEDRIFEHTSAVLWEPKDGVDGPLLRIGPVMRGKNSMVTPDNSLTVGGLIMYKPTTAQSMPTFMFASTAYVIDPDYVGGAPWVAFTAGWEAPPI